MHSHQSHPPVCSTDSHLWLGLGSRSLEFLVHPFYRINLQCSAAVEEEMGKSQCFLDFQPIFLFRAHLHLHFKRSFCHQSRALLSCHASISSFLGLLIHSFTLLLFRSHGAIASFSSFVFVGVASF